LQIEWFDAPASVTAAVVCTGVFDLLHVGHVRFLAGARASGSALIVGVEDDARVRARKGVFRPLIPAAERAELLAGLAVIDGVFLVHGPPELWSPAAYAELLAPLRPAAFAITAGDPAEPGKRDAARRLGARVIVLPLVPDHSSSELMLRARCARDDQAFGAAKSNTWRSSVSGATLSATLIEPKPPITAASIDNSTISGSEK
jgi:D-glycero-beta-D-manno-heptose 1-phosphate adenylyltransferase